jgi:hypothetical protein
MVEFANMLVNIFLYFAKI